MVRVKLTTMVDEEILKVFRQYYTGSIGSFLDGLMLKYLYNVVDERNGG